MTDSISIRQIATPVEWQQHLTALPTRHFLQSWEWGDVKAKNGWQAERFVVCLPDQTTLSEAESTEVEPGMLELSKAEPIGAFQILWRQPIRGVPLRVAYVPKGPLLDWSNANHVVMVLDAIEILTQERRCIFVKIDPDVRIDSASGKALQDLLAQRGWQFSGEQIQFQNTAISSLPAELDSSLAEEQIEKTLQLPMKSKWRYNIRLARKRGMTIRQGGAADFRQFYDLYAETSGRDHFLIRPFEYYETLWQTFLDAQEESENQVGGVLLLAEHAEEETPVAGLFLTRCAEQAVYFNGASSHRRRRDMPNHLLQYEALRWAHAQGCTLYDWWGAPTDLDDADDSMQGVWGFKQGFGAEFQPQIGAWDWPRSKTAYRLYVDGMPRVLKLMRRLRG